MPQIASNFTYLGKKFLDDRQSFNDITAMTSFSAKNLPEGFIAYVKSEDKYYKFNSTNDFDTQLGYWKEYNGETGGSSTDEKVKLNNASESKYLEELIDNSTIEVDTENGVIKAVGLDGLETTVATLNFVKNLDKDIMSYLSSIGNPMAFKGVVADDDELNAIEDMVSGDTYIVQSSASNSNKTMTFIYNGVEFVPMAETSIEVRDFTVEPIDLSTETTGTLHKSKIDQAIARLADVCTLAKYKGSADGVVKQADKITGLTSTISALNDAVTNSHKHTNKAVLDKILNNGIGEGFLADNGMYISFLHIGTTSPNYNSQLWVDNTDSSKPILKIYDGTDWITVSAPSSGSGSGTSSITVDTAMSDTSTNPVQNKVIKDYVDNKAVTVSTVSNNAIETKTDGIYVKKTSVSTDNDNALSEKSNGLYVKDLSGELDKISYAQKTVNEKSDYIYLQTEQTNVALSVNMVIPFNVIANGNMETDSNNSSVKLKAGKTYKISCDIFTDKSGYCRIGLYDLTNDIVLSNFFKSSPDYSTSNVNSSLEYIYAPKFDCEIQMKVQAVGGACRLYGQYNSAYFIVEEVGKTITIDPLEYVNESQGIEDTPIGHIMACMSNSAPKHYLICDGTEYNIADYPYLAEHFKTEFGKVNYFGGNGTNTFCVPDLRGDFLRASGAATRDTGTGASVGIHQDPTYFHNLYKNGDSKTLCVYGYENSSNGNRDAFYNTANYNGGSSNTDAFKLAGTAYQSVNTYQYFTARPTNTSVLYCIKATPTYFMKNTYGGFNVIDLWKGSYIVPCKTTTTYIYETLTLNDSILNYDEIEIYGQWYRTSDSAMGSIGNYRTLTKFFVGENGKISGNFDIYINMVLHVSFAVTGDKSIEVQFGNKAEAFGTTGDAVKIFRIVGYKGSNGSSEGGSCDCVTYTDEEVATEIDTVLEG